MPQIVSLIYRPERDTPQRSTHCYLDDYKVNPGNNAVDERFSGYLQRLHSKDIQFKRQLKATVFEFVYKEEIIEETLPVEEKPDVENTKEEPEVKPTPKRKPSSKPKEENPE